MGAAAGSATGPPPLPGQVPGSASLAGPPQVSARQAVLAGVPERLAACSLRLDDLAASGDAQEVSAALSTAVVDDVLAEHSRELSAIREDLDEIRSTMDGQ